MGEKEGLPVVTSSTSSAPAASPAPSDVSALLEKDSVSIACSPAPSNCSFLSEQEQADGAYNSRQSPFLGVNQPSPSSSFLALPRPEYLNVSIPDSETSSRSSIDGIAPTGRYEYRTRKRKNSSDSSSSEESVRTVGELTDDIINISRKSSRSRHLEEGPLVVPGRGADAPRGRIANIRRESNCSVDNEAANEKLVRAQQLVSTGFEDRMTISSTVPPSPRRNQGVDGPISIVTNSFMPSSCSPSPTRISDNYKVKQCYSPSTQQIVRPNVPYSPSPSPTQSPTRQRLLRSLSPICTKSALKRRYTATGDDIETKRQFAKTSTSPLVTDSTFPYPSSSSSSSGEFVQPPLPASLPTGILSRRPVQFIERERTPEYSTRRTSMDSCSDDQKSVRDDLSEPSSVQPSDEIMELDDSTGTSRTDEESPQDIAICQKMDETLAEAIQVPLPPDDDEL